MQCWGYAKLQLKLRASGCCFTLQRHVFTTWNSSCNEFRERFFIYNTGIVNQTGKKHTRFFERRQKQIGKTCSFLNHNIHHLYRSQKYLPLRTRLCKPLRQSGIGIRFNSKVDTGKLRLCKYYHGYLYCGLHQTFFQKTRCQYIRNSGAVVFYYGHWHVDLGSIWRCSKFDRCQIIAGCRHSGFHLSCLGNGRFLWKRQIDQLR